MSESQNSSIPAWVIESGVESSFRRLPYAIAVISVRLPIHDDDNNPPPSKMVGLYANPTDLQCYRMIARVLESNEAHLRAKLNGMHSLEDSLAVSTAVAVLKQILWQQAGLFVQSLHLGNNSMRPVYEDGVVAKLGLGNDHEPYFYHEHLLCRGGDPQQAYLSMGDEARTAEMPVLGGPPLGTAFEAQQQKRASSPSPKHICAVMRGMQHALREALTLSAQSGNADNGDKNQSAAVDQLLRQARCSVELV